MAVNKPMSVKDTLELVQGKAQELEEDKKAHGDVRKLAVAVSLLATALQTYDARLRVIESMLAGRG